MATKLGLEYGNTTPGTSDEDVWHLVNLTLEEVALIRQALSKYGTVKGRELASKLMEEMGEHPSATDVHVRETRNIGNV
jgi:hypothetical protein